MQDCPDISFNCNTDLLVEEGLKDIDLDKTVVEEVTQEVVSVLELPIIVPKKSKKKNKK